jgi:hypothetical protein
MRGYLFLSNRFGKKTDLIVLLAGILLKLGVYGFLRFSLVLFSDASLFFSPLVYLLSVLGILYASITAIRQTDLKRIIAVRPDFGHLAENRDRQAATKILLNVRLIS